MVYQLKLRKKGILILPKELREQLKLKEDDILTVEIIGDKLVLTPLRPKTVKINLDRVDELLREEYESEMRREEGILGKSGS